MRVIIAGAGITGATIAHELATAGHDVTVRDSRDHIAGNCHTAVDEATGVLQHMYGPHLFHTDDREIFDYLGWFTVWQRYEHRVKTQYQDQVYSMPVNLHSICQLYGRFYTVQEARRAVQDDCVWNPEPANFEEQALATVGRRLYEAFFEGYTSKQWGRSPKDLPASVARRLPVRFTFDDRYFSDRYQALPLFGYTSMILNMLDHGNIMVELESPVDPAERADCDLLVWTGPLDGFFGYEHGRLEYRTLVFERFEKWQEDLGTSVMNFADVDIPWTRATDHSYFDVSDRPHGKPLVIYERSRPAAEGDVLYYPVRLAESLESLETYERLAKMTPDVVFAGRLGQYKYLDMAPAVRAALDLSKQIIKEHS